MTARGCRWPAAAPRQHHGRRHRAQAGGRAAARRTRAPSPCPERRADGRVRARHPHDELWWSPETFDLFGVEPRQLRADARERPRLAPSGGPARIREAPRRGDRRAPSPFSTSSASGGPTAPRSGSATRARRSTTPTASRCERFGIVDGHQRAQARRADPSRRRPAEGRLHRDPLARAAQSAGADPQRRRHASPHRPPTIRKSPGATTSSAARPTQMARLLEDLLDVSRLSRGQLTLRMRARSSSPRSSSTRSRSPNR